MSPELTAKVAEYSEQYDADAMIHAQDVSNYGIQSLIVQPLGSEDGHLHFKNIFPVGTDPEAKSYIMHKSPPTTAY